MIELDREDFRLWLAAKEPDEVVGEARQSERCGVAMYLRERTGLVWEVIPGIGYALAPNPWMHERHLGPAWLEPFALAFDGWDGNGCWRAVGDEVTAKEALSILDNIEMESS